MSFFLFFLPPPSLAGAEGVGLSTNWAGERDGTGRGKGPTGPYTGKSFRDLRPTCRAVLHLACRLYSPHFCPWQAPGARNIKTAASGPLGCRGCICTDGKRVPGRPCCASFVRFGAHLVNGLRGSKIKWAEPPDCDLRQPAYGAAPTKEMG